MNQDYQEPSARLTRRSFNHERLARINQDPFEVPSRSRGRISESPRRFFNYVKDKVQGAVSGLQKLLNSPRSSQAKAVTPVSSYQLPPIAKEKLSDISLSISQTVSKPEFQRHYGVDSHRSTSQKTSFLGVMNFYKDVSGEKIREKMKESNTLVIPPLADSIKKPVSLVSSTRTVKESIRPARRYRDQSDEVYRSESLNLNGKRSMPSILSKKEKKSAKKVEEEKKVRFGPEMRKANLPYNPEISLVRSNSSMIRYISSDDEEEYSKTQKKVFNDEQTGIIKDPPLKISIIKKIKVNPFQKSRVEKTSVSEYLRSVKGSKGKGFDKFLGGKLNNENSYGSDNILNDSKIETDSDDSSLLHNHFESRDFNNYKGREEELSEVGEEPFPGKAESPILEHVEEQDIEKEESEPEEEMKEPVVEQKEEKVEKKVTPVQPEPATKPVLFSGLFGQKEIKPVVEEKNVTPVAPVENSEPAKPKLFNFGNNTLPKEPVAAPVVPQETVASSKPSAISQLLQSVVEDDKKDEIVPSVPVVEANKSSILPRSNSSLFSEDALKNPLFANLVNKPKAEEPAMDDNPFLSKSIPRTLSFTNIIGGTIASAPKVETVLEKPQATETVFNNPIQNTDNSSPFTSEPKPTGILGILQRSQSTVSDAGSSIFSNTLKPVGSFSWMGSNSNTESQPANNLFGNLANNNQSQAAQPQGGVFGGLFSNNNNASNNNTTGSGMAFEGGNSMMGENQNNNNNNSGSLFGGNSGMSFGNNNSGASAFGGNNLFQNSGSSSVFGGNSFNQNNNSNPFTSGGMGGGFQADSSNPFLSQEAGSGSGSGSSGLFGGNNQSSGFGGGNTNFGSGKKGKNQRDRAF